MLKWDDPDHSGTDHGLAIDDVTINWTISSAPEINIKQGSTSITTGGTYGFGDQTSGTSSGITTFTIENTGSGPLNLTGTPNKIAISGTNSAEFTVDQSSTSTPVAASGTTTFTITFNPTSQGAKTAAISIANDDATGGENPYVINLTGTGTVNAASDIVETSGYTYPTNIAYGSYQAANITGGSSDIEIAKFTIRDGGATSDADNLPTTLTQVVLNVGNSANIQRIALYDGGTEVGTEQPGASTVTFSGLSLSAVDGGTKDFSVRVSFKSSVTDNQQISLAIASTTTAASTGSTFAATNAGGASTTLGANDNKIVVTASDLLFDIDPSTVSLGAVMSPAPTIWALDANGNTDLDFAGPVTLSTTGTFDPSAITSVSAGPGTGIFTFSSLIFSAPGTGITINGSATGVNPTGNSTAFDVTNPQPEINVKQSTTQVNTGDTYGFGNRVSGTSTTAVTFTIENLGTANLNLTGTPKISIGGTDPSEFTVDQSLTSSPVAPSGTTTFTITFSPTSQGSKSAVISIDNNDGTGSENPYIINLTGTGTVNTGSDITSYGGYTYTSNVDYASYQATSALTQLNSLGAFGMTLRDGGGSTDSDNLGTTLTALTISTGGSTAIRTAALFDGTGNIAEVAVNGATSIVFTGLGMTAADGAMKDFELRVTYESTVTDNQQITVTVTSATASSSGSGFFASNAGGASSNPTGDVNRIEVTATKLKFVQQPSNTNTNATMTPAVTIEATDANDNRDLDLTGSAGLVSSGTMTGPVTASLTSGFGTYGSIIHTVAGTGLTLTGSLTGLTNAASNTFNILAVPAMTELVVPQYMGSKTGSSTNNARTPIAVCIRIDNLTPSTTYDIRIGLALTSEASTSYGAGSVWAGSAFGTVNPTFTTDGSGSSGPYWVYLQPTGNGTRFDAGQIHNLRIGYVATGGSMPSSPVFVGSKTITSLDIASTQRTTATTDDGAFIKGSCLSASFGKYVLLYDNIAGTGDPLFSYMIRTAVPTNTTQSQLPVAINDIYLQSGTSAIGDYPAVIPIGANNPNGVRRIESRNADNTTAYYDVDPDGIWPSGANTTTVLRLAVVTITNSDAPLAPCINPTNGGTIGNAQTGCGTFDPAAITSISLPSGQSGTLEYKWQESITDAGSGFSDITSTNSVTYDPSTITQTTWYKRLARVTCMSDWTGAAESNVVEMTVNPAPEVTDHYRSKTTGNWSSPSTWERSPNGTDWCDATSVPTSNALSITIQTGHTVTVDVNSSASSLLLTGGLSFSGSTTLGITGAFTGAGTFTCGTGTVDFSGSGAQTIPAQTYYNLTVSNGGIKTQGGIISVTGNMYVSPGVQFTAMGYNFTVTGTTTVDGTFYFGASTGTKTFSGDVTINATGNWDHSATNQALYFGGSLANSGIFDISSSASHFTGTGKTFTGSIVLNGVDIGGSYTNNGTLEAAGEISGTGSLTQGAGAMLRIGTLLSTPITVSSFNATATGNTLDFTRSGGPQYYPATDYYNITNSGGGSRRFKEGTTRIAGIFTKNGPFYYTDNTTIIFNGTDGAQALPGLTFNNLTIDNANGVTLADDVVVDGTLDLLNGIITPGSKTLTVGVAGNITNASATSYVNGKLARIYTTSGGSKDFAIGKGGNYRPLSLNYTSLDAESTVTAEQVEGAMPETLPGGITLFGDRYWTLSQTGATAFAYYVTLDGTDFNPALPAKMLKGDGVSAIAYTVTTPDYTNETAFTSFSDFGLGETSCTNPSSGGTIGNAQANCGSFDPAAITSASPASGGTGTIEYKWQESITGSGSGFSDIGSSNSVTYDPSTITQTTWYKRLARVTCKSDWTGATESNVVEMTVNALPADPGNPASNSPGCGGVTITRSGTPPSGVTWWWQTGPSGTMMFASGETYYVNVSGTYYLRARNNSTGCWSAGSGSATVIVNVKPNGPGNPTSDSPQCADVGVTLTRAAAPPAGFTYYWQTSPGGVI